MHEAGGRCSICGYDRCLANLHFHHVDPAEKSFAMSTATGKSLAAYREEARKCILVCANCHGELEAGLAGQSEPSSGTSRIVRIGDGSRKRSPARAPTVAIQSVVWTPIVAPSAPPSAVPTGRTP